MTTSEALAIFAPFAAVITGALYVGGELKSLKTMVEQWNAFQKKEIPERVAVLESRVSGMAT